MGGCRCIFRDCHVNSGSFPGMHFFHFPIKQKEKLDLWIKYAKAEHILHLTPSQMKNKVVCNTHFRDECFMNYKKDRLTREAVPTLIRLDKPNMVLDYEISDNPKPTKLPITTAKHLLPPSTSAELQAEVMFLQSLENDINSQIKNDKISEEIQNISEDSTDNYCSILEIEKGLEEDNILETENELKPIHKLIETPSEHENLPIKKVKTFNTTPKILNRNAGPNNNKMNAITKPRSPNVKRKAVLLNGTKTTKMYKNPKKVKCINEEVLFSSIAPPIVIDIQEIDDNNIPLCTEKPKIIMEKKIDDLLEKQKLDYEKQIQELHEKLKAKDLEISKVTQIETVSTSKQSVQLSPIVQPKQLTKGQLFNGIKKYLCPSMSALVRMEMFSEPERDWKTDEKQAAMELLQLGDTVFDYFRDEWRFRLPPKKNVEQWMSASNNMDDDEDL